MSYQDVLEAAWKQHLAPRAQHALTVISTFAGCGGSSLGYSMAGFRELLAVEWDDNAAATFRLNFPDVPLYHGDIAKLTVEDVLARTGLRPGELDVFDGSPPCQGFSTAGKRDFGDDRNQLFREYVRLLRGLKPKVFVMENVSGMVKGKMKLIFADILRELKASGYRVSARLMNAMYFNVPQSRQRMIFIGVREDMGVEPAHPRAQTRLASARTATVGVPVDQQELAQLIQAGQKYNSYRIWNNLQPGQNGRFGNHYRIDPDKPVRTIEKMDGNLSTNGAMHWADKRRPTLREFARFGSFPDVFRFVDEYKHGVNRIGNSVPPLFMRAIAEHIRDTIVSRPSTARAA